jgi:hypothetical protein
VLSLAVSDAALTFAMSLSPKSELGVPQKFAF